jgi:hypothetical protein
MSESSTLKADRLLELWARELANEGQANYATSNTLDGNYALSVAGQRNPLKSYLKPKETRSPPHAHVDTELLLIDSIMSKIGKVNDKYVTCIKYAYTYGMKSAAREMQVSLTKAKELKNTAFDMAVLLLEEA